MNFIMHMIYTRVNTFYGYNWHDLFCSLLTLKSAAAVRRPLDCLDLVLTSTIGPSDIASSLDSNSREVQS